MPQPNNSASVQLRKLEKLAKRIIRKSLKNNTLDYTVQIGISSLDSNKITYAAMISAPHAGVQPIMLSYDNFDMLVAALEEAEKAYNPRTVEIAFHENRINTFKRKIEQHEERKAQLEDPNYKPEDDIPMEEVSTDETETN